MESVVYTHVYRGITEYASFIYNFAAFNHSKSKGHQHIDTLIDISNTNDQYLPTISKTNENKKQK